MPLKKKVLTIIKIMKFKDSFVVRSVLNKEQKYEIIHSSNFYKADLSPKAN